MYDLIGLPFTALHVHWADSGNRNVVVLRGVHVVRLALVFFRCYLLFLHGFRAPSMDAESSLKPHLSQRARQDCTD